MNPHRDDEGPARIFAALRDPQSLRLLLHVLEVGQYDPEEASELGATDADTRHQLSILVDVGLLVGSPAGRSEDVYQLADAAAVKGLLAAVRQLGARTHDM